MEWSVDISLYNPVFGSINIAENSRKSLIVSNMLTINLADTYRDRKSVV